MFNLLSAFPIISVVLHFCPRCEASSEWTGCLLMCQSCQTSFPKLMCEERRKRSGRSRRRGLAARGWEVIWSRLKSELEGLVTEAYLWWRHRGCETVILWEELLQPKRGEKFLNVEEKWGSHSRINWENNIFCQIICFNSM